ncbi:MAG TPA: hypothetical protein VN829_03470 [Dongiaceae bacterium]|nr:hypothetical protein [Dongiaceae bacterium]
MNTDPAKNQLLDEVLADAASPAFRADLLRLTLERVQSRKQQRRRNRGLLAAACVLLVLATAARFLSPPNAPKRGHDNPLVVHSRPLEAQMLVTTRPRGPGLVRSSASAIAWVRTSPAKRTFDVIGDDQLFALLGGRPAALIRRGPARAELVLLDPADRDGFPAR